MAIWEALVDGDKRRLNDDGTLFLLQVFGVGLPPARRLKVRSPQQHGSTDIGFRYDEREMRLGFFFNALNTSAAVAKRDEIYAFWRSLTDTPIQLRYTREDNTVRQIDCHVVGVVDMPWNPDENQHGLQNFVVQVEAANPLWYDPTAEVVSFTSEDNGDWWLGLGTIDSGDVTFYDEFVSEVELLTATTTSNVWTILFVTDADGVYATGRPVQANGPLAGGALAVSYGTQYSVNYANSGYTIPPSDWDVDYAYGLIAAGSHVYMAVCSGTYVYLYRDNVLTATIGDGTHTYRSITNVFWRGVTGQPWEPEIPYCAVYDIALNNTQRTSLMASLTVYDVSKTITYTGSFLAYPIITITGPITDPVLTNVSTGEDLDFTGVTIAGGDTYTIDCRFGYKTVKNAAGVNKIADLTAGSDLATFHLGADPDVSGGANAFTLTGTATDANTTVTITYNERFVGA